MCNNSDPFGLCVTPETAVVCVGAAKTSGLALAGAGVAVVAAGGAVVATGAAIVGSRESATGVSLGGVENTLRTAALRAQFGAVRRDYWKGEAANSAESYSEENVERMKRGRAPIGSDGEPMELHHKIPLNKGGTNDRENLQPMTQTEHRRGENYKKNHPGDE